MNSYPDEEGHINEDLMIMMCQRNDIVLNLLNQNLIYSSQVCIGNFKAHLCQTPVQTLTMPCRNIQKSYSKHVSNIKICDCHGKQDVRHTLTHQLPEY